MKRKVYAVLLLTFLLVTSIMVMMPVIAMAEETASPAEPPANFMTPDYLMSFAGQLMLVMLLVQFFKLKADRLFGGHFPTEVIVFAFAVIARCLAQLLNSGPDGFTLAFIPTCAFEAFQVAVAAMYTFDKAKIVEDKAAAITMAQDEALQAKPPNVADGSVSQ